MIQVPNIAINPVSPWGYELCLYFFSVLYGAKHEKDSVLTADHSTPLTLICSLSLCLSSFGNFKSCPWFGEIPEIQAASFWQNGLSAFVWRNPLYWFSIAAVHELPQSSGWKQHKCIIFVVCALTGDWIHNLGVSGWCSNQLSYLARATSLLYYSSGIQTSKVGIAGLKSRCQQAVFPSGCSRGEIHFLALSSFQKLPQSLAHGPFFHLQS